MRMKGPPSNPALRGAMTYRGEAAESNQNHRLFDLQIKTARAEIKETW
jgi:hypothetical protein